MSCMCGSPDCPYCGPALGGQAVYDDELLLELAGKMPGISNLPAEEQESIAQWFAEVVAEAIEQAVNTALDRFMDDQRAERDYAVEWEQGCSR